MRSPGKGMTDHFNGCQAGKLVMGIEADGAVKGCPSLQSRHYIGGTLKEQPLEEIWNNTPQLAFARTRTVEDLWGFCRTHVPVRKDVHGRLHLRRAFAVRSPGQQSVLPLPGERLHLAKQA